MRCGAAFRLPKLAVAVVALALAFGGGTLQGLWSDALVQLCSLPLLGLAIVRLGRAPLRKEDKGPLALIGGLVLLFLLQLVPLPPFVWTSLPGRAPFVAAYQAAGMAEPWEPLSLDPGATWFSLFSILPATAVFLATLFLGFKARRVVSLVVLGFAFASVLLGLAQLAGGGSSGLRFYTPTNPGSSVGFFANRNHYAALLTAAIPISAAWFVGLSGARKVTRPLILIPILAYVFLLLGLGMAHSRAGLILALVGGLASTALAVGPAAKNDGPSGRLKLPLVFVCANLCGLLLAFQFGFVSLANRLENQSVLADLRWPIAETTTRAIVADLPMGVGFGAFERVYQMFESPKATRPEYINHAHDDWLEVFLDGGLPALVLMLAFLTWYARATVRLWRAPSRGSALDTALARAGPIVIGLLLLHSTVDYPLRTTTLMVVFAFAAALMIPPVESSGESGAPSQRLQRHHRQSASDSTRSANRAAARRPRTNLPPRKDAAQALKLLMNSPRWFAPDGLST